MISDETLWSSGLSVLTNILNTSTDAVIIIDTLGVILRVNDMTVRMFGITSSGLIGQNVAILMPEPHHSLHDSYLRNRAGHVIGTEGRPLRALHADGRSFEVFLSVTAIQEQSSVVAFCGFVKNMSASGAGSQRALASSSSSVTSVTNTIDDTDAYWSDVAVHEHDQSQTDTAVQTDAGAFREIDYADLRFLSTTPLGRGAFGIVFAAEWRGVKVAVKKLMAIVDLDAAAADVQSECALMMRCNHHPNIVKFIGAARDGGTLCIVTQFCAHGSVFDAFVVRREPFSAAESVRILHDAALGVSHLHKESVIHRDIAARNVLLDEHNHVFVTDFGLARIKVAGLQSTKSMLGPVKYMAPEAIAKRRFSEASDAFSFGVLVWEVTHRQELYIGMEMFDVAVGVVAGTLRPTIESTIAPRLNALMQSCWKSAPHDRPTFSEIIAQLGV